MRVENRPILCALVFSAVLHGAAAAVLVAPPSPVSKAQEGTLEVRLLRVESLASTRTSTQGESRHLSRRSAGGLITVSAQSSVKTPSPVNSRLSERRSLQPPVVAQSRETGSKGTSPSPAEVLPPRGSSRLFLTHSKELSASNYAAAGHRQRVALAALSSSPLISRAEGAASGSAGGYETPQLAKPSRTAATAAVTTFPTRPSVGSSGYDLKPLCVSCPTPIYPVRARREGWQGVVEVALRMAEDGSVQTAELRRSSGHAALDLAALDVAHRSRFALPPGGGRKAGHMKYRFVLNNSGKHKRGGR